jgi:hypothetical protein
MMCDKTCQPRLQLLAEFWSQLIQATPPVLNFLHSEEDRDAAKAIRGRIALNAPRALALGAKRWSC